MATKTSTAICRHGTFEFPNDFYIGKALDLLGEYSEAEVAFLCSLLKPGDVFVEAGANVGALTVPVARWLGDTSRVLAFEPQADIHAMLLKNS